MSVVDSFLNITDYFSGETISLHPNRCLNSRFRQIDCTICADACPAENAITIEHGTPAIDNDVCIHCGLCLHVCPTNAFTRPDPTLKRLSQTIAALPPDVVSLICPQHPNPARGQTAIAVQTKRCLAALSPAHLLPLARRNKPVVLDDSHCADCPIGAVHPYIEQSVARTNAWAETLGEHTPVRLQTQQSTDTPIVPRVVVDIDRPPVSRRGFFQSIRRLGKESVGVMLAETPVDPASLGRSVPVSERLPHFVPPQRAKVLLFLDENLEGIATDPAPLAHTDDGSLPVVDVVVAPEKCTACGLCARFCPTGALTFLTDENKFALGFYPALCLGDDCGICEIACPEDAISLENIASTPAVLSKQPRYLAAGALTACVMCGQPIAAGDEYPNTCYACRPHKNFEFQFP